jgi:hypothetical protein
MGLPCETHQRRGQGARARLLPRRTAEASQRRLGAHPNPSRRNHHGDVPCDAVQAAHGATTNATGGGAGV